MLPYLIALSGLVTHVPDCPYVSRAGAMRVLGAPLDSVSIRPTLDATAKVVGSVCIYRAGDRFMTVSIVAYSTSAAAEAARATIGESCTMVDGTQLISIGVGGPGMSRAPMAQRGFPTPGAYSEPIRCARKM